MADTTPLTRSSATEGSLLIPKTIYNTLIEAVEKKLLGRDLAAIYIGPGGIPGSSVDVDLVTADSMKVFKVAEGTAIPIDTPDYTSTNIKPDKYAVRPLITKEMMEDSKFDLMAHALKHAGREIAENENELIEVVLNTAANTVSGGASITLANITRAMQYLEDSDFEPTDLVVGPEVANDLRNIDTFVEAQKHGSAEMMSNGFIGTIFGMNVHVVSGAIYTSTYAWVFDRNQAFAIVEKRPVTVDRYNDLTRDMVGAVVTQRITMKALRTSAMCIITTT